MTQSTKDLRKSVVEGDELDEELTKNNDDFNWANFCEWCSMGKYYIVNISLVCLYPLK